MFSLSHNITRRFRSISGIVLLVCFGELGTVRVVAQADNEPLVGPLAEGVRLLGAGQLPEAAKVFEAAKQGNPQDARPYFYRGMALAQAGQLEDGAAELVEAVHLAPERLEYRVFQAHVFEQLKQTFEAETTLAVFIQEHALRQLSVAWLRLLADVYYRLQKTEEALRTLDLWAERDPKDARIDLFRGQVYVVKGQPDVALKFFQSSLAKSDQNPQAYFELGKILYEKNQLAAAKEAILSAVRENGTNPEYRVKLASVYAALGEPNAAIDCLKSVESAGDRFPTIYYVLARAYRSKGDASRNAEYVEKFQRATNADRDRQAQLLAADRPIAQAQRQLDGGHVAEARALFEKALQVDPNRWEPNANLAEMALESGNLQAAYPYLQKLEQISPESTVGNFLMARYWFQRKEFSRARVYAEKVRISRPANSELRALLGDIYLELGEKQKAREEYEEAVHLAPERSDLRERLRKIAGVELNLGESSRP
jgi:tetratricopeptide (TPR) repeat protein